MTLGYKHLAPSTREPSETRLALQAALLEACAAWVVTLGNPRRKVERSRWAQVMEQIKKAIEAAKEAEG